MNRKIPISLPRWAALVGALLAGVTVAAVDPAWFEVGWPLETPANDRYFDVPLSAEVYGHAPSLEQLAVLDARNEPMPFYRVTVDPPAAGEQRVVLAASPVYASQADGSLAQLSVSSGNGRTALTVTRPADATETDVAAFVVDARNVERAPTAIELDWRALPQPFLLNVRVEQSNDLTSWRAAGRGSVAQLAVGDVEARHARVPVSARAGGYLRIAWERNVPGFYVERVSLVSADQAEAPLLNVRLPALDRAPPRGDTTAGGPEPLYFDAGGALPVAAATVHFAAGSGWLTADVAAADSLDGPWQPVAYRTLLYEVDYGGTHFASPPVAVGRNDKRYWRVTPAEPLGRDR
ncbi:MAG TPA: DUF3999 family protein, partial [Gammaproteobacteria bacterium]|nr:DUF3999 family protein [Gammaproteobacteria bacterium]